MSDAELREQLARVLGAPVVEMSQGHYYDLPDGFVKPASYPGLVGQEFTTGLTKGYLDMGLVDPKAKGIDSPAFQKKVLREVVKLLVASKGKSAFIRDPEWVLKVVFNYGMVKNVLQDGVREALEAMFEKKVAVLIAGLKGKSGFGWRLSAPGIASGVAA